MKRARGSTRARTFGLVAMSAGLHLILFTMLGFIPAPSQVLAMRDVEMEVLEPEPEPEQPPPPPPPEPEPPPPEPERKAAPKPQAAPEPEPPPQEAAPPPEEIADFTGETLTAEGGSSWSSAVGSGAAMKGPIGKIGPRPAPVEQNVAKAAAPAGPRFVPVQSLARKPQAPAGLNALLERNFPRRARLQGVEGKAQVRLRILPSGKLTGFKVIDESPQGFEFGSACVEALRQAPPFLPPLDRSGVAVETEINFNCSFEVAY